MSKKTQWWGQPYTLKPGVKVKGFPRPLYPPDASAQGKAPSRDGPDVEAYKRTVSRAGRWPWQNFDDSFSNGFSHGSSSNVKDTGLAGVQRQQHLDDTGWLGQTTFNLLRAIVVPKGFQHAGEMAMDDVSIHLINEAFVMFGGHEPPPVPTSTLRQVALSNATAQIGEIESPSGSNMTKFGDWYGYNGVPWCAIFVTWCFEHAGDSPSFIRGSRYSYVPYIVSDARASLHGLHTTDDPIPGDLVCYDWAWDGIYDHVGIFEQWSPESPSVFYAIEGNTSGADNSNGGQVMRRHRDRTDQSTVFVRVAEP